MWQLLSCIPIDRYITAAVPLLDLRPSSEFSGKVSKFLRSLADFLLALAFFVAITQYQPPPPSAVGGATLVPNFEKGGSEKKMSAWGVLTSPCHRYLPGGGGRAAYYVSCQKTTL